MNSEKEILGLLERKEKQISKAESEKNKAFFKAMVTGDSKDYAKYAEKEKELNKKLDNPKVAIGDYLEYIQRGISDTKAFDANMKKASQVWENRDAESFKKNYKSVKKFVIVQEPKVVSQKNGSAVVTVRVKQTNLGTDGKEYEKESTITYNLAADKNGKWRIKSNIVK